MQNHINAMSSDPHILQAIAQETGTPLRLSACTAINLTRLHQTSMLKDVFKLAFIAIGHLKVTPEKSR